MLTHNISRYACHSENAFAHGGTLKYTIEADEFDFCADSYVTEYIPFALERPLTVCDVLLEPGMRSSQATRWYRYMRLKASGCWHRQKLSCSRRARHARNGTSLWLKPMCS